MNGHHFISGRSVSGGTAEHRGNPERPRSRGRRRHPFDSATDPLEPPQAPERGRPPSPSSRSGRTGAIRRGPAYDGTGNLWGPGSNGTPLQCRAPASSITSRPTTALALAPWARAGPHHSYDAKDNGTWFYESNRTFRDGLIPDGRDGPRGSPPSSSHPTPGLVEIAAGPDGNIWASPSRT